MMSINTDCIDTFESNDTSPDAKHTSTRSLTFLLITLCLTLNCITNPARAAEEETVIDLLVLYTPGLAAAYEGDASTRINHLIAVSNQIYADSNLNLRLRVVHSLQVDYPDGGASVDALKAATQGTGAFSNVNTLRSQYGADMVVIYRPYQYSHGNCGIAWVGGNKTNGDFQGFWKGYMVSHVSATVCPAYVTAHELGHNMGLYHSRKQDGQGGTFHYSLGHGVDNSFVTIMAYPNAFNVPWNSGVQYKLSSPNLNCGGQPCGVDKNDTTAGADAVATLEVSTPQIAAFYATQVNDDDGGDDGSDDGGDDGSDDGGDGGGDDDTESDAVKRAREAMEAALTALNTAISELQTIKKEENDADARIEELDEAINQLKVERKDLAQEYQEARTTYYSARKALSEAEMAQRRDSSVDTSDEEAALEEAEALYNKLAEERIKLKEAITEAKAEKKETKSIKRAASRSISTAKRNYREKRRAYKNAKRKYEKLVDETQGASILS